MRPREDAQLDGVTGQNVRLINESGQLIAIGVYDDEEKAVRPKIVLI